MSIFGTQVAAVAATTVVPTAATVAAQQAEQRAAIISASTALEPQGSVMVPGCTRPLYPHQQAAVEYISAALTRFGGAIVGDDMGMGKTAVALSMVALWKQAGATGPTIIVTPPAVLGGLQREMREAFPALTMTVVQGRKPLPKVPTTDIVWMSDDSLTMRAHLTEVDLHASKTGERVEVASRLVHAAAGFIRDEAHRDKGVGGRPKGVRSRAATSLLVADALRIAGKPVLAMTGTLTLNRPVEAIIPIKMAGGSHLLKTIAESTSEHGFLVRFCTGRQTVVGGKVKSSWDGAQNLDVLHSNLRSTVYVRREKADLDPASLPNFGWAVVPMAFSEALLGPLTRIEKDMLALIEEQHGVEAMMRASRAEAIVRITKMRQELGRVKAEAAARYVADLIDDSDGRDSVVVFYEHGAAHDALLKAFMGAGLTTCSLNGAEKNKGEVIELFQSRVERLAALDAAVDAEDYVAIAAATAALDEAPQVMLIQMGAGGQGVTVTAARHAVWVQLGWSGIAQQKDRIFRCDAITKARAERGETVQYHVLETVRVDGRTTFDGALWSVVQGKQAVCDAVNIGREGATISEEAVMTAALNEWYANVH